MVPGVVPSWAAKMPRLDFRPREVAQALDLKVCDETRRRGEVNCWVVVDGRRLLRITRPQVHRGGSVPRGTLASIRRATRLNVEEFERLIRCSMSRGEYRDLIRRKRDAGLL